MMKFLAICLILSFAVACKAAGCDFSCDKNDPTKFTWHEIVLQCEDGKICNKKCKEPENTDKCIKTEDVCKYTCDGNKVIETVTINDATVENVYTCPNNMKCNDLENNPYCDKMCVPGKCQNAAFYDCLDDRRVNIKGMVINCPLSTKCNKKKEYPCAICLDQTGRMSKIHSWLTEQES